MTLSGVDAGLRFARQCRALGHPARVTILRYLTSRRTGTTCGEIVRQLPLAQSTVSRHLVVLREAGFIRSTEQPPRVLYFAEPGAIDTLFREVSALQSAAVTGSPTSGGR